MKTRASLAEEVSNGDSMQASEHKCLSITVLCGGPSAERQVSFQSGQAVAEALRAAGHDVTLADISPDNLTALQRDGLDVVFVALHGQFGEDGQLQRILEQRSIPFCGSDSDACRLAFDKQLAKQRFAQESIPTPDFDIVNCDKDLRAAKAAWSLPVVVKPVRQGSSIGITIVQHYEQLEPTIRRTLTRFGPVMVEEYISGRELTVGIVAGRALPIIEIRTNQQFYDYQAKYDDEHTQYLFDIDLDAQTYQHVQQISVAAARCLGMRDFCRVDLRMGAGGRPYVLEVNAIPGFTSHSLLPKAAARAGMDMPQFCDMIVQMTMTRAASSSRL